MDQRRETSPRGRPDGRLSPRAFCAGPAPDRAERRSSNRRTRFRFPSGRAAAPWPCPRRQSRFFAMVRLLSVSIRVVDAAGWNPTRQSERAAACAKTHDAACDESNHRNARIMRCSPKRYGLGRIIHRDGETGANAIRTKRRSDPVTCGHADLTRARVELASEPETAGSRNATGAGLRSRGHEAHQVGWPICSRSRQELRHVRAPAERAYAHGARSSLPKRRPLVRILVHMHGISRPSARDRVLVSGRKADS